MIKKVQSPTPYFIRGVLLAIAENIVYIIIVMLGLAIILLMDGAEGGLHNTIIRNHLLNGFSESVFAWGEKLGQYPAIVVIIMLIVPNTFFHYKLSLMKANLIKDAGLLKSYAVMGMILIGALTLALAYWSIGRGIAY